MRARLNRRAASSKPKGRTHGRDHKSGNRESELEPRETEAPPSGEPAPLVAHPHAKRARMLELAEEHLRRLHRRIQEYRRTHRDGPRRLQIIAAERDIDLRIEQGDPVAVGDALGDAAEFFLDLRREWEREIGLR
jgi:hypothetical protein